MAKTIGFIGLGEAGHIIARGLRDAGAPPIHAYDVAAGSEQWRPILERRAAESGVTLVVSVADLAQRSDIVIAAVTSSVAVSVAEQAAPHLEPRHLYVDINSTAPAVKQKVGSIVESSGARFVEAAVMAGVPPLGHKVPMLLCGEAAGEVIAELAPYGMNLEDFGAEIGRATATKMFRSIVVKGLEALFLECVLASSRYGVTERVFESLAVGYPGLDWDRLAHYLIGRSALHGERRAHELVEVAETLKALGIEPIMAEAGARRIAGVAQYGLKARFGDKAPESYHEVMRAIREAEEGTGVA